MPGYRTHITAGMFLYPIGLMLYEIFYISKGEIFMPQIKILVASYILYIIGTDIPDIDAEAAPVRWFVHSLFPTFTLYMFWRFNIDEFFKNYFGVFWGFVLFVAFAILIGFLFGFILKLLSHRGFMHTVTFALIYGVASSLLVHYILSITYKDFVFLAFSGFFGVMVHLILDEKGLRAFKRWW